MSPTEKYENAWIHQSTQIQQWGKADPGTKTTPYTDLKANGHYGHIIQ